MIYPKKIWLLPDDKTLWLLIENFKKEKEMNTTSKFMRKFLIWYQNNKNDIDWKKIEKEKEYSWKNRKHIVVYPDPNIVLEFRTIKKQYFKFRMADMLPTLIVHYITINNKDK